MIEFKGIAATGHLHERYVKAQGIVNHSLENLRVHITLQGKVGYGVTDFLQAHHRHVLNEGSRQLRNVLRQEKSTVGCASLHHSLFKCDVVLRIIGIIISHLESWGLGFL